MTPTLLAAVHGDGHPLDIVDVAQFLAELGEAGAGASTVPLIRTVHTADDQPAPITTIAALVTEDQAARLPDHIAITVLDGISLEDALARTLEV